MKKLGVLVLALVMALSFAACSKNEGTNSSTTAPAPAPAAKTEVEKYVDEYGEVLIEAFETGFEQDGEMTCESEIEGRGNEIILTTRVLEIDGLSSEEKDFMQEYFDEMTPSLKEGFVGVESAIPALERFTIKLCESDGDIIATVVLDF